jgi:diacylglycerol kinase family enzyme
VTRILIANPVASAVTPRLVRRVAAELAAGGPVDTWLTTHRGHATELAASAVAGASAVYALGGDGVFNEVVNGIGSHVPVGFIPGGATNVLSRALGLPRDPIACARQVAAAGRTRTIALGRLDGRRFTFSCGIGFDAELVRGVDRRGRRRGRRAGDAAFVWEGVHILRHDRWRLEARMTVEGLGRCAFVLVANCDPYTYAGPLALHLAPRADFAGGLDVVAPVGAGPAALPGLVWRLVRPTGRDDPAILRLHDADLVRVVCDRPTAVHVDGEDLGDLTEATVAAERDALTVLV